jgi:acyl-CoA thioesterase FadM
VVPASDADAGAAPRLPEELARFVKPRIGDGPARPVAEPVLADLIGATNAFGWTWRLPYFYCHFNERVQMTGFLRLMEEVVDLFLADRGLPIKRVLDEKGLIPVVTRSEITLLDEVRMEEQVHTVYTVEGIFKDLLYTSRMDCYVVRDGRAVLAATGTITHGYLHEERPNEWTMATFDDEVRSALEGPRP